MQSIHLKVGVVESVVIDALEEVCQSVLPLEGTIDATGETHPVLDRLRVATADRGVTLTVEPPVLVTCGSTTGW